LFCTRKAYIFDIIEVVVEMRNKEIEALISLIDDPDMKIYEEIKQNLVNKGLDIINELENAWEISQNELSQERLENIIQQIQFADILNNINNWHLNENDNLLKGACLIAKYQYPDLQFKDIESKIEEIRKDAWMELNENLTALEKIKILNHIIFDIHKFTKNSTNFYSPANSFINQTLETKKGNTISLAIIYLSIAQSLDLPIYGVNLPNNFILAFKDEHIDASVYLDDFSENILFYINPFNRGGVFGKREIDYFLRNQKLEPKASYYSPCSNTEIIERLIASLIVSYNKLGYVDKIGELKLILKSLK